MPISTMFIQHGTRGLEAIRQVNKTEHNHIGMKEVKLSFSLFCSKLI